MTAPPKYPKKLVECLRQDPDNPNWMHLTEDYPIMYKNRGTWYRFWLRTPWKYDVASIPRIFWPIISPRELGYEPPAGHDEVYYKLGVVRIEEWSDKLKRGGWLRSTGGLSRKQADKLFAVLLRQHGVAKWRRRLAYLAVRANSLWHGDKWPEEGR